MKLEAKILAVLAALSCGACASTSTPVSEPVAVKTGSTEIIYGPAPVPSPGSYRTGSDYGQSREVPAMSNDNPGNGVTLGRSRNF